MDCLLGRGLLVRRGEGILAVEDLESLLRSRSWPLSTRPADSGSLVSRSLSQPSPDSPLAMGVAVGSIETADRTGKTRSAMPGLRAEKGPSDFCDHVGEAGGGSVLPVNIETGDSRALNDMRPGGSARCDGSTVGLG